MKNSEIFDLIRAQRKNIKDETIRDYLRNISKISRELFDSKDVNVNFFRDHESVTEYLNKIKNPFSRKTVCTSILVYLKASNFDKDNLKVYTSYHKGLAVIHDDIYKKNTKSSKEEENWVTKDEINEMIEKIKIKIQKDVFSSNVKKVDAYQQKLVLSLYTMLPPVRNDYVDAIVKNEDFSESNLDKDYNYINFFDDSMYLCNYKTSKFYGTQKIKLNPELLNLIKEYQDIKKKYLNYNGEFMLINVSNCTRMNSNTLTKYLNKIFKPKKVSTTILRKVYLSEKYPINHSMNDMEKDASIMGHDITTARKIYTKIL